MSQASYRGVVYDTENKGQTQVQHPGNQVYRGVEVDYSTYQQQSQQQSEQQPRIYRGVAYVVMAQPLISLTASILLGGYSIYIH
jgi:hypothetical protein